MRWLLGILLGLALAVGVQWRREEAVPTLTVWVTATEYEFLSGVNADFDAQIELVVVPAGQVAGRLPLARVSHRAPDIVNLPHTLITEMAVQGYLAPMTDLFWELDILPAATYAFKVMGEFYGIPYGAATDLLFYRRSAFPDGIDRLDEEMRVAINYRSLLHSLPFMTGFGGNAVGFDNFGDINFYDIGLNSEASALGLRFMVDILDPGIVGQTDFELFESFLSGASDVLIAPAHLLATLEEAMPDVGFQPLPTMLEGYVPRTYMNLSTYQLVADSAQLELARSYLRFLMSDEVLAARGAALPIYRHLNPGDPFYGAMKLQLGQALPVPNQLEFSYLYGAYQQAATRFIRAPQDMARILNEVVMDIDRELDYILR